LQDDRHPEVFFDLSLKVLLPDRDPPGPRPEYPLLGARFLAHYEMRVTFDYAALRYLPGPAGQRLPDPLAQCGHLEIA
jgi:hypothetical protein